LESIAFILADSLAMYHMILLAVASAIGQLFIFYTIKEFGPVIFTIMMTTRQILSLILSCIVFSHPLNLASWCGAILVFAVVLNRIKRKGSD
jgi:adenosine 3'-phospho 5'-phosphosulfate transporter B2